MTIRPRAEIDALEPVPHGGFPGPSAEPLLDFSANTLPAGLTPRVWEALAQVPLAQHPDPDARLLRAHLAACERVAVEQVGVGNGAVALIYALGLAYLR